MPKKNDKKVERITAHSIVVKAFNRKKKTSDEAIIKEVKAKCSGSKFGPKMLGWYKSRAKHGFLKGVKSSDLS